MQYKMQLIWFIAYFVAVSSQYSCFDAVDFDELAESDIVRIKYTRFTNTYLRGDNSQISASQFNQYMTDYLLWQVEENTKGYGKMFKNVGSGLYLKANNAGDCFADIITGEGDAGSWNKLGSKFINHKYNGCCDVESPNDDDIDYSACDKHTQDAVFEKKADYEYFLLDMFHTEWNHAAEVCEGAGGPGVATLATITSEQDNDRVLAEASFASLQIVWIGLNDITTETVYEWRDSYGTPYSENSYNNWGINYPNTDNADCVGMNRITGRWVRLNCKTKKPFVCMWCEF